MLGDFGIILGCCFPVLRVQNVSGLLPLSCSNGCLNGLDGTSGTGGHVLCQGRTQTLKPHKDTG